MHEPFRVPPALPPEHMQTYRIVSPRDTLLVAACKDAVPVCGAWRNGWDTTVDESTGFGQAQAHYIRARSARTFREYRTQSGLTVFRFESGQRCFTEHRTRPEIYAVAGGDWRGNPRGVAPRRHVRPVDWVEDMALTLDDIKTARDRG